VPAETLLMGGLEPADQSRPLRSSIVARVRAVVWAFDFCDLCHELIGSVMYVQSML
jgi:hypothetical protein